MELKRICKQPEFWKLVTGVILIFPSIYIVLYKLLDTIAEWKANVLVSGYYDDYQEIIYGMYPGASNFLMFYAILTLAGVYLIIHTDLNKLKE